jgi:hypothetical protein
MARFGLSTVPLTSILCALLCASASAQNGADPVAPRHSKPVPPSVEPSPFTTDSSTQNRKYSIEFRQAGQMSRKDQLAVADAESSVAEHAGFAGFEFEQGKWNYQQVVCPALPNHIFLQYTRNNGAGDVTVFSASIPRGGEGRVRIIPILRRGYSLFSPAPINALTISAFNHIRAEEPDKDAADWLGNGLCYAALAGAHPELAPLEANPTVEKPGTEVTAVMSVGFQGKDQEVVKFADVSAMPRPMEWTMIFTRKGKLIKATHSSASLYKVKAVPQNAADLKSSPVSPDTDN